MEEVSEVEDCTYYDEEEESTDEEESEEEDPAESEEYFQSKDETLIWSSIPPSDRRRMLTAERAERETSQHGPTTYARSVVENTADTNCLCGEQRPDLKGLQQDVAPLGFQDTKGSADSLQLLFKLHNDCVLPFSEHVLPNRTPKYVLGKNNLAHLVLRNASYNASTNRTQVSKATHGKGGVTPTGHALCSASRK
ncbi:hypothetical protein F2P81_005975 [Scophthalmus maximus]|uniref:Uncharacterized protein n=1 Tax=Scophthalmus maximus TaxID=52904 RepID=A0A6A4T8Q1_SCOMX|nr:hypothetical protein F2P81_005975 [Scophthalmus maximus]